MANKKKGKDSKKGNESKMFTQFTPKDRGQIEFGLAQGYSLSKIARIIGRFVSSVAREVMTYAIWIEAKFRNRDCAVGHARDSIILPYARTVLTSCQKPVTNWVRLLSATGAGTRTNVLCQRGFTTRT